ncbi:hypothetical protein CC80DRAFT_547744 [Byssothecium circinans]|uniref:Uncharacterized protein n=1 Tax=Byssothecium circinans TaxID=147558 RepID=A0A6A5TY78_9PLEO|nr:hypothetical protein CC80DRAFT_547744 [Byssothecium circinans]
MSLTRPAPFHPNPSFKRPSRSSLRHIGIPDGTDVLAVYLWWARQRRFRAHLELRGPRPEVASSVRSVLGADDEREPLSPVLPIARSNFQLREASFDLRGVGSQFE